MRNYELPILRRFSPYGLIASEGPLSRRRTSNLACRCEYDSLCINQVLYLISDWLAIINRLTKCPREETKPSVRIMTYRLLLRRRFRRSHKGVVIIKL